MSIGGTGDRQGGLRDGSPSVYILCFCIFVFFSRGGVTEGMRLTSTLSISDTDRQTNELQYSSVVSGSGRRRRRSIGSMLVTVSAYCR